MSPRIIVKKIAQGFFVGMTFPSAVLCGFGKFFRAYITFAHLYALAPGVLGDYLRSAFYYLTLRECSLDTVIAFGTFFSRRDACLENNVCIGSYCVIGRARIGARTQIASHVEIPSGRYQHNRAADGRFLDSVDGEVMIGEDCWIGASAIVMADVGAGSTIGAGSVVVKEIPPGTVAAGNPARPIRPMAAVCPEAQESRGEIR
jgi:acetyltransferase-like isoleucine patch superfamily enzyme